MPAMALALLLGSVSAPSFAGQYLEGSPDDGLTATVSRSEPNLIRVEGRKIRRIQGVEGEFLVTPDKETGAAYLKPNTDKPILSVFVADDAGRHWKLMLKVADVPAETLVIRDRSRSRVEGRAFLADESRNAAIRRVLLALARDTEPEDMSARDTLVIVPLWNEARFVLVRTLEGALLGEDRCQDIQQPGRCDEDCERKQAQRADRVCSHLIILVIAALRVGVTGGAVGLAAHLLLLPLGSRDLARLSAPAWKFGNAQRCVLRGDAFQQLSSITLAAGVAGILGQVASDLLGRRGIDAGIVAEVILQVSHHA